MLTLKFNKTILSLTAHQLYRTIYSTNLESYVCLFNDSIKNSFDFEKMYDKASRLANISTVKTLNNKEATKAFLNYMEDLYSMDSIYKAEDLNFDIEEAQGNKYIVNVYHSKEEYLIDNFTIYAPNYAVALDRAKTLTMYKTPQEL